MLNIIKEMNGLVDINTFDLEAGRPPPGIKVLPSKFVLKVRADGSFDKAKARIVVCGNCAKPGVDYFSTFSPMATFTSIRTLMSIGVHHG